VVIGTFNHLDCQLRVVFQCTWRDCAETFFGYYTRRDGKQGTADYLVKVAPISPQKANFAESVSKVSTDFIEIYNQAIAAESAGLDEIAGIGLRKALEFLIKDFCINQHPTEIVAIKNMDLGPCIKKYCDDARLISAASRAVWLGNDEAHYTRRWIDREHYRFKNVDKGIWKGHNFGFK
jgi:hypothetical protein